MFCFCVSLYIMVKWKLKYIKYNYFVFIMTIKGIILDIDGVIIGQKIGFNSPSPHPDVIRALREIRLKGIFISLCTAKPHFAVDDIINLAKLDNLHISDGGSVII